MQVVLPGDTLPPKLFGQSVIHLGYYRHIKWDWYKALEKNCFPWPKKSDNKKFSLSQEQFNWLLSGIDPWKIKPHEELHYTII